MDPLERITTFMKEYQLEYQLGKGGIRNVLKIA